MKDEGALRRSNTDSDHYMVTAKVKQKINKQKIQGCANHVGCAKTKQQRSKRGLC